MDYEFVVSYHYNFSGHDAWTLRAQGSLNENGCSTQDGVHGGNKATLDICKEFCKGAKFLQYHASTHCGCFKGCDFKRPANNYSSTADVYEQQNFGMISSTKLPSLHYKDYYH